MVQPEVLLERDQGHNLKQLRKKMGSRLGKGFLTGWLKVKFKNYIFHSQSGILYICPALHLHGKGKQRRSRTHPCKYPSEKKNASLSYCSFPHSGRAVSQSVLGACYFANRDWGGGQAAASVLRFPLRPQTEAIHLVRISTGGSLHPTLALLGDPYTGAGSCHPGEKLFHQEGTPYGVFPTP